MAAARSLSLLVLGVILSIGCVLGPFAAVSNAAPNDVFVLGDSVLLGARERLVDAIGPDRVLVDARVNRSTLEGARVLEARRGEVGDVIVVQLGHNDAGSTGIYRARVDAVMRHLTGVPRVLWLTMSEVRPSYAAGNRVLREIAQRYRNMEVVEWAAVVANTPGLTSDGLHLTPEGAAAMASLITFSVAAGGPQGAGRAAGVPTGIATPVTTVPPTTTVPATTVAGPPTTAPAPPPSVAAATTVSIPPKTPATPADRTTISYDLVPTTLTALGDEQALVPGAPATPASTTGLILAGGAIAVAVGAGLFSIAALRRLGPEHRPHPDSRRRMLPPNLRG